MTSSLYLPSARIAGYATTSGTGNVNGISVSICEKIKHRETDSDKITVLGVLIYSRRIKSEFTDCC